MILSYVLSRFTDGDMFKKMEICLRKYSQLALVLLVHLPDEINFDRTF